MIVQVGLGTSFPNSSHLCVSCFGQLKFSRPGELERYIDNLHYPLCDQHVLNDADAFFLQQTTKMYNTVGLAACYMIEIASHGSNWISPPLRS